VKPRSSLRWGACFVLALGIHAAGAAALLAHWHEDSDLVANAPVIMIELAAVPVAPDIKPTEAPPGPEQTEAQPQPEASEAGRETDREESRATGRAAGRTAARGHAAAEADRKAGRKEAPAKAGQPEQRSEPG
jgi:outer membrane biosynthesis protein TonB